MRNSEHKKSKTARFIIQTKSSTGVHVSFIRMYSNLKWCSFRAKAVWIWDCRTSYRKPLIFLNFIIVSFSFSINLFTQIFSGCWPVFRTWCISPSNCWLQGNCKNLFQPKCHSSPLCSRVLNFVRYLCPSTNILSVTSCAVDIYDNTNIMHL